MKNIFKTFKTPLLALSIAFFIAFAGAKTAEGLICTPVSQGGTGVCTITGIIKGNGTSAFTAASSGTDYEVPITFSTGLTRTTNTVTVNTTQNISRLSNLSTNGLIKTGSANGTLSIATGDSDYQNPITLTTTGTSGAATFTGDTLNIPQYTGGGGGTVTSVTSANGNATIATTTTTPVITIVSAPKLQTARTIGGTSFDGTGNIAIGALNSTNVGATTSSELAGVISDETGSGALVFGTGPTISLASASTATTQSAFDNSTKLATTAYVDAATTSLDSKPTVAYASTSALPANTYSNGTSGVGATLTGSSNGPLVVDGVTILVGQVGERILVAGESTSANNGWYTITQQGVVAVSPYILTRATESDQAAEIGAGYLTSVIAPNSVTPGSSNNGKVFISVAADPFTVGTTSVTFSQVGSTYSAGTGLTLSGSTFSVNSSQSIATLSNLTSNGFVKTSGGAGTLSIDTTSYVPTTTTVAGFALSGNVTLANLTATNGTLTFSGTYAGDTARTIGLNLSNANTWAALQTFGTNISIGGVTATGATGTGNIVFGTTPTLATPVINGLATGTGVASAATASTLVARDANANITANNWLGGYTTTATAAGTTTLTVGSTYIQYFTGSTTQTVTLPVASTLTLGHQFVIVNNSTGAVTVNSSGSNAVIVLAGGSSTTVTCILTSGTSAASWATSYSGVSVASGKLLTASNTITLAGTDSTTMTFPSSSDTVTGIAATQTLTNKRINPRTATITSSATPTPAGDTTDEFTVTALAAGATFAAPTGTPVEGQKLMIRIKDNGSAQTLAFNAIYRASSDLALPTTTVISKTMYLGFVYNNTDSKWDFVSYLNNF